MNKKLFINSLKTIATLIRTFRLQKELGNLDLNLTDLTGKMRELEWVEEVLLRTKRALEHDITLKTFSQHLYSEVLAKRRGIRVESMVFCNQKL